MSFNSRHEDEPPVTPLMREIRSEVMALENLLRTRIHTGRQLSMTLTKLEELGMWADKAAREGGI